MNRDPLGHRAFSELIADLWYPAAMLGQLGQVGGREGWEDVLPHLTRPDRRRLLLQLGDVLLAATPAGAARLGRWRRDEKALPPMARADWHEWIDFRLSFYGDRAFLPIICEGLATVPQCVQDEVLRVAAWVGVGLNSAAWTSSARFVDREDRAKTRLVVLGPATDAALVRHEASHVWHTEDSPTSMAISAQGEAGFRRLAQSQGWQAHIEDHVQRDERLADACAWLWSQETGG